MSASIWNPASSIPSTVNANNTLKSEAQTATAGQTLITLSLFAYQPGTGTLLVFVNGIVQALGADYTESSSTTVTFVSPLNLGDYVLIYGFVGISVTLTATTGGVFWGGIATGTADSIAVTATGVLIYYNGLTVVFQAAADNTTTCTLNVSGLGAVPLVNELGQSFAKLLRTGATYTAVYNSGKFYLTKDSTFYTLGAGISLPHVGLMSIPEATWETTTSVFKLGDELSIFDSTSELNSALVKGAIKVGTGLYNYQFTGIPAQMIEFTSAGDIVFKGAAAGVVGNPITWTNTFTVGNLGIGSLTVTGPITSTFVAPGFGNTRGLISAGSSFYLGTTSKSSIIDSSSLAISGIVSLSSTLTVSGVISSTTGSIVASAGNFVLNGSNSGQFLAFSNSVSPGLAGNIFGTDAVEFGSQLNSSYIFSKVATELMGNARFQYTGTYNYDRLDVAQPAYKFSVTSTGTPGIVCSYAAAAANPITWTTLEVLTNTTKTTYIVNLRHETVAPTETFKDTSAAADTKIWDTQYSATVKSDRIWNDASSVSTTYQTVTRTAHTAATVNFPLGIVTSGNPTTNYVNTITTAQYFESPQEGTVLSAISAAFSTVGKTASGAAKIWAALDVVPSWAKVIYVTALTTTSGTAIGNNAVEIYARKNGSAAVAGSSTQIAFNRAWSGVINAGTTVVLNSNIPIPINNGPVMFDVLTVLTNQGITTAAELTLCGWA